MLYGSQSSYGKVLTKAGAKISAVEDEAVAKEPTHELEVSLEQAPELLRGAAQLHVTNFRGVPNAQLADTKKQAHQPAAGPAGPTLPPAARTPSPVSRWPTTTSRLSIGP